MPMITVKNLEEQSRAAKQKMATGIKNTAVPATGLKPTGMWIVFEDAAAGEWYIGDNDCT